ncbi:MAG: Lrp/AsnC family transcriptional regulator [Acidimicrobiia bacterium]|jgi:DNA-binding Lrp family transcriptional regulator|nr:MAG: Lrp/AsnC family transcriptional regulator [Acidimicrobiia bacterium]
MAFSAALDPIDKAILRALAKDARASNKDIAAAAGIAPSTCSERLRRLERDGVITEYRVVLDPGALGLAIQALIAIRIRRHAPDDLERFRAAVMELPEVVHLFHVTGANDYLVHVVVRDSDDLRRFAVDSLVAMPEVTHIETSLIFEHLRGAGLTAPPM